MFKLKLYEKNTHFYSTGFLTCGLCSFGCGHEDKPATATYNSKAGTVTLLNETTAGYWVWCAGAQSDCVIGGPKDGMFISNDAPFKSEVNNGHGTILDTLTHDEDGLIASINDAYANDHLAELANNSDYSRIFEKAGSQRQDIIDKLLDNTYNVMIFNNSDLMVYAGSPENPEFIYLTVLP